MSTVARSPATDGFFTAGFEFGGTSLRALDVADAALLGGRVRAVRPVRATGPVLFARCSLGEAELTGCSLPGSLFDECDLSLTAFGPVSYRGCDLRGNDLSSVAGVHHLKRVVLDRAQVLQLASALVLELEVAFGDDAWDDRPSQ